MANLPIILVVAAFLLTLINAFTHSYWASVPAGYPRYFPHLGWLGVSLYFLSLLVR